MPEAVVCIIKNKNKILGIARKNDLSNIGLPGGKVEPGESLEKAIIREVKEETNLEIKSPLNLVHHSLNGSMLVYTFVVENWDGTLQGTTREGEVVWCKPSEFTNKSCEFHEYNKKLFEKLKII